MKKQKKAEAPRLSTFLRDVRKQLGFTQQALATALKVKRATVSIWEGSSGEYHPSGEILMRFATLAAQRGLLNECRTLLEQTGLRPEVLSLLLAEEEANRPVLSPAIPTGADASSALMPQDDVATVMGKRTTCVRVSGSVPGLYPFRIGDLAFVDSSRRNDLWQLVEDSALVAVHFDRYPEVLDGVRLSKSELIGLHASATKRDRAELRRHVAAVEESTRTNAEELKVRLQPDEHGTIGIEATQIGWLTLERADDPLFQMRGDQDEWLNAGEGGPWRIVLRGAQVRGVTSAAGFVPLTRWETKASWKSRPPVKLIFWNIVGEVVSWTRARQGDGDLPVLSGGKA